MYLNYGYAGMRNRWIGIDDMVLTANGGGTLPLIEYCPKNLYNKFKTSVGISEGKSKSNFLSKEQCRQMLLDMFNSDNRPLVLHNGVINGVMGSIPYSFTVDKYSDCVSTKDGSTLGMYIWFNLLNPDILKVNNLQVTIDYLDNRVVWAKVWHKDTIDKYHPNSIYKVCVPYEFIVGYLIKSQALRNQSIDILLRFTSIKVCQGSKDNILYDGLLGMSGNANNSFLW